MTLPLADLTEKQLERIVVDLLELTGWKTPPAGVYHTYRSQRSQPGYPDWSCWRDRHLWLELKSRRGKLSPHQKQVIRGMLAAGDEVYVIREPDLDDLAAVLRHKGSVWPTVAWDARLRLEERTRQEIGDEPPHDWVDGQLGHLEAS